MLNRYNIAEIEQSIQNAGKDKIEAIEAHKKKMLELEQKIQEAKNNLMQEKQAKFSLMWQ